MGQDYHTPLGDGAQTKKRNAALLELNKYNSGGCMCCEHTMTDFNASIEEIPS